MKEQLIKRLKSFGWRLLGMGCAMSLAFVADNLDLVQLSPAVITVIGLAIGEATKWVNNYFSLNSA